MMKEIPESELLIVVEEEIAALDNLVRPTWKKHRTKIEALPAEREDGSHAQLYLLARSGSEVLVYDPLGKNFSTGVLDDDAVLRRWTVYGTYLRDALRHFPKHSV